MDVSIIIVTRNTCALTRTAVQSVCGSRDSLVKEIFVVDNGSTDETATALSSEFPTLRLIRSESNLGFARACNLAAKQASGEFLLLLNSDAGLAPDALSQAIEWMRVNPDCAVAGAQLLNPNGSRQNSIANFPTLATELLNKSLLRRLWPKKFPGKETEFHEPVEVETIVGAFVFVRKSIWDLLGGLDERFFFFFEETDFCLRARRKEFRIVHLPNVRIWHGQGQTAKQVSIGARIEYWRSRYAYFKKNHRFPTRMFLAGGLLARLFFDWFAATLLVSLAFGQSARWRSRRRICSALLGWHLRGCPAKAGLPR
ncbi:MAG TPA: glycosyltransferase family 2 protein [Candidatus Dormibacteraeota bacterium]|nr:glycosyltransferase family 2 protein [Candidatus Dormibacteraeota bacterium]